jgi:hypothetical protein
MFNWLVDTNLNNKVDFKQINIIPELLFVLPFVRCR